MSASFDLCVIGAGPAGFAAAVRAWDYGKRVALIERGVLGGAALTNGALSSKTLWELAREFARAQHSHRGYEWTSVDASFERSKTCVEQAIGVKVGQLQQQLDALSAPGKRGPGSIELIRGSASFLDPHHLQVEGVGGVRTLEAAHFIIATGSRPSRLPTIPVDGEIIMTSDNIMGLKGFPESLVVLGGGVVGCEYATVFTAYGKTKVSIIDRAPRILPFEDEDVALHCASNLEARGARIHSGAKLVSMGVKDGRVSYVLEMPGGGQETFDAERALISIGRTPNTDQLALEKAGVQLSPRGHVINTMTRTGVPHIHAIGDVTDDIALVSVGEIEGRYAVERMFGERGEDLSYDHLSTIMFLDPEVAAVGLNEQQAVQAKIPYRMASYSYRFVNRAVAMGATDGFVKLLVADDGSMRILGMRALGAHASTSIQAVSYMIKYGRPASELAELIHPHPAVTEGLQECVRLLMGSSIYKPSVFDEGLRVQRVTYDTEGKPRIV